MPLQTNPVVFWPDKGACRLRKLIGIKVGDPLGDTLSSKWRFPMKTAFLASLILTTTPLYAQDLADGATIFQFHCATCHGLEAMGNGPMAPALMVQPSNLRQLKAKNDGVFPITRVIMRIDGRDPLVSHGSSMPIFGDFFEGYDVALRTETGQPIMTSKPILDLMGYLEAIQEE